MENIENTERRSVTAVTAGTGGDGASGRKSITALFLCLLLGPLGVHRFYLGYAGSGALMLALWLSGWVLRMPAVGLVPIFMTTVMALADLAMITVGILPDAEGKPLAD